MELHNVTLKFNKKKAKLPKLEWTSPPPSLKHINDIPNEIVSEIKEFCPEKDSINSCKKCGDYIPILKKKAICNYCDTFRKWNNRIIEKLKECYNSKYEEKWGKIWKKNLPKVTIEKYKEIRKQHVCENCGKIIKNCYVGKRDYNLEFEDDNTIACCLVCLRKNYNTFSI